MLVECIFHSPLHLMLPILTCVVTVKRPLSSVGSTVCVCVGGWSMHFLVLSFRALFSRALEGWRGISVTPMCVLLCWVRKQVHSQSFSWARLISSRSTWAGCANIRDSEFTGAGWLIPYGQKAEAPWVLTHSCHGSVCQQNFTLLSPEGDGTGLDTDMRLSACLASLTCSL